LSVSLFDGFRFRVVSSPIHRLDPRVKFLFVSVLFVGAVLFSELIPLLVLFLAPIPLVVLAGVRREWARSLRGAAFFAAFIFIFNFIFPYFFPTAGPGIEPPIDTPMEYAVLAERALVMTLRLLVLVGSFSAFFLTTSPDHLSLALEQSRVPYELCFAFTTAVRFVPVLAEEAQTITDAQRARGLELEKGNFLRRVRNYIPILIPLIVNAIRRSLELAEAMESRAWGATENRTNLYVLRMRRVDYTLLLVSALVLAAAVYVKLAIPVPSVVSLLYP